MGQRDVTHPKAREKWQSEAEGAKIVAFVPGKRTVFLTLCTLSDLPTY